MLNFAVGNAKKNTCMLRENMNETRLKSEKLVSLIRMLLLAISLCRALLTVGHFFLISSFVLSRPPGRKMVYCRLLILFNLKVISCLPFWFESLSY